MIDQVPDYLFVKDLKARFVVANKAVAADLGHGDPTALLGKTDLELHPPELAARFYKNDKHVMATGEALLDVEEYVVREDGFKRWLATSKLPLRDSDGEIVGLVGIARDITERKRAEDHIRRLAYFDTLTNLPNRTNLERALNLAASSMDEGENGALLYIDLDRFKFVNDSLGHPSGDELLRQVAGRLADLVGPDDMVARLGGDEFAVLLAHESEEEAASTPCEFVLAAMRQPFSLFGQVAHIGASIGLTTIRRGSTLEQALREADIALYEAKGGGRGHWRAFEARMAEALERRRLVEQDLRTALKADDQLSLVYQPVYAPSRMIIGAEALVRWKHPELGPLSPADFVAVAEERGLIEELGEWVLRRAISDVKASELPWVAVNVSPLQLRNPGFAERVGDILSTEGLNPRRLQLEITEGVLIENAETATAEIRQLRLMGVRIAIDDFGTGYSSLNYLQNYEVDKLKIDRSFVAKLGSSAGANAIVAAIVNVARSFGMEVTAEGVETEDQVRILLELGCGELQGYYLSRPVEIGIVRTLLHLRPMR